MRRVRQLIREEMYGFQPRLMLVRLLVSPLPEHTCSRLRTRVLRWAGFRVGFGTTFAGMPSMSGSGDLRRRVRFGDHCWINTGLRLDVGDTISLGDHVVIGPDVMFVTSAHEYGAPDHRAGRLTAAPIFVEAGAWLGARCTILPGVTIGRGAVVAAGAVVHRDVPPNTLVGGVPARVIRELPSDGSPQTYPLVAPLSDAHYLTNAPAVTAGAATEN